MATVTAPVTMMMVMPAAQVTEVGTHEGRPA
jgi:hypothetical protein